MPEPMIEVTPTRNWRPFSRARLRDAIGPSNPLYDILEREMFQDVYKFVDDDFITSLDTTFWTASNSGGAGVANFARQAGATGVACGVIQGDGGTDADGDARLFGTSNLTVTGNRRPILFGRIGHQSAVTTSKFEFGLVDAVAAGAVNVKATPTSTRADYAVIIRDTVDDVLVSMVTDGGTDAVTSVDPSPSLAAAYATQTWYTLALSVDEVRGCRYYIDGVFRGVIRSGPDATVALAPWIYTQSRTTASRTFRVDYVTGWAERVPFSGDAFTT